MQKQNEKLKSFGELLLKCRAMDLRRHPERSEIIAAFYSQAIRDASFFVRGTAPPDILEDARAKVEAR